MIFAQSLEKAGGPGGTRTPNQAVMSGRKPNRSVAKSEFYLILAPNISAYNRSFLSGNCREDLRIHQWMTLA